MKEAEKRPEGEQVNSEPMQVGVWYVCGKPYPEITYQKAMEIFRKLTDKRNKLKNKGGESR